ncbi:hypothetical protein OAO01_09675, partial [Oligoflexia bacterium]|nr:hypothetical protein [Oligoflexia bacterium]
MPFSFFDRHSAHAPGQGERRDAVQNRLSFSNSRWLTTFGDLLTLLLCFFLCVITFSPPTTQQETPLHNTSSRNLTRNQPEAVEPKPDQPAGTLIAPLMSEFKALEIRFTEADYIEGTTRLSGSALARLRNEINSDGYRAMEMLIAACAPDHSAGSAQSWFSSTGRVFNLRGQLLDARMDTTGLQLQVLGAQCAGLGAGLESAEEAQPHGEMVVALVQMKLKRMTNG